MYNVQFFDSQQSVYANQTPYYRMPLSMLRVLLYGCFFHSGISKLARQPYVLDCFALMLCSSKALRNLSEPPTLTLIIPL